MRVEINIFNSFNRGSMDINPIQSNNSLNNNVPLEKVIPNHHAYIFNYYYVQTKRVYDYVNETLSGFIYSLPSDRNGIRPPFVSEVLRTAQAWRDRLFRSAFNNGDNLVVDTIDTLDALKRDVLNHLPNLNKFEKKYSISFARDLATLASRIHKGAHVLNNLQRIVNGQWNSKEIHLPDDPFVETESEKIDATLLHYYTQINPQNELLKQDNAEFRKINNDFHGSSTPTVENLNALNDFNKYLSQRIIDLNEAIRSTTTSLEIEIINLPERNKLTDLNNKISYLKKKLTVIGLLIEGAKNKNNQVVIDQQEIKKKEVEGQIKILREEKAKLEEQITSLTAELQNKIKKLIEEGNAKGYVPESSVGSLNYFKEINNFISNNIRALGGDPISNKEIAQKLGLNNSSQITHNKSTLSKKLNRLNKHLKI